MELSVNKVKALQQGITYMLDRDDLASCLLNALVDNAKTPA